MPFESGKEIDLLTKGKIPDGSPATSADDNEAIESIKYICYTCQKEVDPDNHNPKHKVGTKNINNQGLMEETSLSSVSGPPADSNMNVMSSNVHVKPKGEDEVVGENDPLLLNENYIVDQFGVVYRPVYAGESINVNAPDILIYKNKYYTTEGVGNCPFCKGAGKVTVEKLGLKDCPDCDGTGDVQNAPMQQPMGGQPQIPNLMSQVPQQQQQIQQQSQQLQAQNQMKQPQTQLPVPDLQQMQQQSQQQQPEEEKKSLTDLDDEKNIAGEHYDDDGTFWFTTSNGRKVGIKKGQTLEQALSDAGIPTEELHPNKKNVDGADLAKKEQTDKSKVPDNWDDMSEDEKKNHMKQFSSDDPDSFNKFSQNLVKHHQSNNSKNTKDEWWHGSWKNAPFKERLDYVKSAFGNLDEDEQIKMADSDEAPDRSARTTPRSYKGSPFEKDDEEDWKKLTPNERNDLLDDTVGDKVGLKTYKQFYDGDWTGIPVKYQKLILQKWKKNTPKGYDVSGEALSEDFDIKTIRSIQDPDAGKKFNLPIRASGVYWKCNLCDHKEYYMGSFDDPTPIKPHLKDAHGIGESKANESCGCPKKKAQEANIIKYKEYITSQLNVLKKKAKAGEAVSIMYGLPSIQKNGRKIKGTLAYAGVSLNDRIYLPEELAKGHGMTLSLLLNHSSTAGAEQELWRLEDDMLEALYNEEDYQVGEVTLTWDPKKLTLFYEGVVTHPFFQKEIDDANMAVSLGIYYDSNSPRVCDENCYTLIKGAEFREVSLVYHAGFPIATIEAVEAELKEKALRSIEKTQKMTNLSSVIDKVNKANEPEGGWTDDDKVEGSEELDQILPTGQPIDVEPVGKSEPATQQITLKSEPRIEPPTKDNVDQVPLIGEAFIAPAPFTVRGVSAMTISNINGVQKYKLEPYNGYESNTIHFEVVGDGATIFGEGLQLQPKMTTPKNVTREIESKPKLKVEDGGKDVINNL